MLRVCAVEKALAISVALNVDGENVDGLKVDGLKVDGENVDGENVDGENVDGLNVDGENVDGLKTEGENVDGLKVDGLYASGLNVDGLNVDGENVDGLNVDGAYSAVSLRRSGASRRRRIELALERLADVLERREVVVGRQSAELDVDPLTRRDGELVPAGLAGSVDEVAGGRRRTLEEERLGPGVVVAGAELTHEDAGLARGDVIFTVTKPPD